MYPVSLSIFFPCYNEAGNLETLIRETIGAITGLVQQYEILIIDDGSSDKTGAIADGLCAADEHLRVIHHEKNSGYGAALISGFKNVRYDWVFFADGDNQFDIREIELLLKHTTDYDAIIGYRKKRSDPPHRILFATLWKFLVYLVLGFRVRDLDCAFKLIRREFIKKIELTSKGAVISAELLLNLHRAGARFKEVGVTHRPRRFGTQTGGNPFVIFKAFRELLRLYKHYNSAGKK